MSETEIIYEGPLAMIKVIEDNGEERVEIEGPEEKESE